MSKIENPKSPKSKIENPLQTLPPAAAKIFLILFAYADHSQPRLVVSISIPELATAANFSPRWCIDALQHLSAAGFLCTRKRRYHRANLYLLAFPMAPRRPAQ